MNSSRESSTIRLGGRLALAVIGLALSVGLTRAGMLSKLTGIFGLLLFITAIGFLEVGLAGWHHFHRRHTH